MVGGVINPRRKILTRKFQLEATVGKILKLIAWLQPDGNGKHLYPVAHEHRKVSSSHSVFRHVSSEDRFLARVSS